MSSLVSVCILNMALAIGFNERISSEDINGLPVIFAAMLFTFGKLP